MPLLHRKTESWEVVDIETVNPIPTYTEEELHGLHIVKTHDATIRRRYMFELRKVTDIRAAVRFARQCLMEDATTKGCNVFLTEGWSVTHLRMGARHRADVHYSGRPALAANEPTTTRLPPFLEIIPVPEEAKEMETDSLGANETDSSSETSPRRGSLFEVAYLRRWSTRRSKDTSSDVDHSRHRNSKSMHETRNDAQDHADTSSNRETRSRKSRRGSLIRIGSLVISERDGPLLLPSFNDYTDTYCTSVEQ